MKTIKNMFIYTLENNIYNIIQSCPLVVNNLRVHQLVNR